MRLTVEFLIEKYKDNVYSAAYNVCGDPQDAEDIMQETFMKYYRVNALFDLPIDESKADPAKAKELLEQPYEVQEESVNSASD